MSEDTTAAGLLAAIDAEQLRLRELLVAKDASVLTARPPNGKWSVIENVRHLLFAEQAHLGRLVTEGRAWNPLGLSPNDFQDQRRLRMLGSEAMSLPEVLNAWQTIHAAAGTVANTDTEAVRIALQRHLIHLRAHIHVIERLVRRS